jgi:ankyrin repeat protein
MSKGNMSPDLIECLFSADEEKVERALDMGADINYQNQDGRTPIMEIAQLHVPGKFNGVLSERHFPYDLDYIKTRCNYMFKFFLTRGADVSIVDNEGNTALMIAVYGKLSDWISLFRPYRGNIGHQNNKGENIFMIGARNRLHLYGFERYFDEVSYAMKKGIVVDENINPLNFINDQDNEGNTVLSFAAKYKNFKMIDLLLKYKFLCVSIDIPNKRGFTALSLAISEYDKAKNSNDKRDYLEIIDKLFAHGADINNMRTSESMKDNYKRLITGPLFELFNKHNDKRRNGHDLSVKPLFDLDE